MDNIFIEKNTGAVFTEQELKNLFIKRFNGNMNIMTFEDFLDGEHFEVDANGKMYACYFEPANHR